MSNVNDSGPAFPVILDDTRDLGHMYDKGVTGLSMRDYFAAKALPIAYRAHIAVLRADTSPNEFEEISFDRDEDAEPDGQDVLSPCLAAWEIAKDCYTIADAMLKARKVGP